MTPKPTNLSKCPPPRGFRPAGLLKLVELPLQGPRPLKTKRQRYTPVQKVGLGFERKVQADFYSRFDNYVPSPWVRFLPSGADRWRWCQPDGLFVDVASGRITIVEIKLRHTHHAWWQIRRLYEPVLRHYFGPNWTFSAVEVVRWYDGTVPFPESYVLAPNPREIADGRIGLHISKVK